MKMGLTRFVHSIPSVAFSFFATPKVLPAHPPASMDDPMLVENRAVLDFHGNTDGFGCASYMDDSFRSAHALVANRVLDERGLPVKVLRLDEFRSAIHITSRLEGGALAALSIEAGESPKVDLEDMPPAVWEAAKREYIDPAHYNRLIVCGAFYGFTNLEDKPRDFWDFLDRPGSSMEKKVSEAGNAFFYNKTIGETITIPVEILRRVEREHALKNVKFAKEQSRYCFSWDGASHGDFLVLKKLVSGGKIDLDSYYSPTLGALKYADRNLCLPSGVVELGRQDDVLILAWPSDSMSDKAPWEGGPKGYMSIPFIRLPTGRIVIAEGFYWQDRKLYFDGKNFKRVEGDRVRRIYEHTGLNDPELDRFTPRRLRLSPRRLKSLRSYREFGYGDCDGLLTKKQRAQLGEDYDAADAAEIIVTGDYHSHFRARTTDELYLGKALREWGFNAVNYSNTNHDEIRIFTASYNGYFYFGMWDDGEGFYLPRHVKSRVGPHDRGKGLSVITAQRVDHFYNVSTSDGHRMIGIVKMRSQPE